MHEIVKEDTTTRLYALKANPQGFNALSVRFSYIKANGYGSRSRTQGYYVSVTPVERETRNGYTIVSEVPSDGLLCLVREASRRSRSARNDAENGHRDLVLNVINQVLTKHNLRLEEGF